MTHPNTLPSSVTETPETDSDRVSECPMCGQREFLRVIESPPLEQESEPWGFHVICSARGLYTVGYKPTHPVGCGTAGGWGETVSDAIAAWNRRPTPSLPPRSGGVVVKGLEWEGDRSKSVVGTYATVRTPDGYAVTFDGEEIAHIGHNSVSAFEGARNAAQSHAQADYEARIRSTLADPIPEAPADEEVEGVIPEAIRVPLDELDADAGYMFGRVAADGSTAGMMAATMRGKLSAIRTALRSRSTETDKPGVREALDNSNSLFAAILHEPRPHGEIETQIAENRAAIRALSASPLTEEQSAALQDVVAERKRQVQAPEHDDGYANGEMACAAGVYALSAGSRDYRWVLKGLPCNDYLEAAMKLWPWDWAWWKPTNRRRDLVKAGALIIAEIERLDRLPRSTTGGAK